MTVSVLGDRLRAGRVASPVVPVPEVGTFASTSLGAHRAYWRDAA